MEGNRIRAEFLRFFEERDHVVVPSASLIPVDPTLLLTVAGMVPFKPYLLGEEPAPYPRAVSSQKAVRTEDIDIVGTTASHFTFFEMLGNFSFGDYFKEKAIPWAYEFITERLGLDPDVLWYTVYKDDDEAAEIWIDGVGVPADRVQRGDKDNFWQMGVAGPCGPSSEIFADRGEQYGPAGGAIGGGPDRFVEVWNLVFMQHVQDVPYNVVGDLPAKNIDTGLGLDRAAMVLQRAENVFETDLVRPLVATAEQLTGTRYGERAGSDVSLRVLADHGRALTFLIGDGVVPSNEGRGYIVRRLLRRAVRHAWSLGSRTAVTPDLVDATMEIMGEAYPALAAQRDFVAQTAEREEMRFRKTLESGHYLLEDAFDQLDEEAYLSGVTAFKLHDTFGFPIELTEEIAGERGVAVDRAEFDTMMQQQRERARAAWKGGDAAEAAELYRGILDDLGPTEFLGYEATTAGARVLAILREGELTDRAEEGQDVELFLDRTPFYAESGGQVGDIGALTTETGQVRVDDTQYGLPGLHGHRASVTAGSVQVGQDVEVTVDAARRERIRKSHTGTHLLHWALREVVGKHVQQAGSLVEAGRLRFDFSHHTAVDHEALAAAEQAVNERIIENATVTAVEKSKEEAERMGALAFFGDKYGERVRVVQAGDYSRELCGGTHVPSTGQVGPLVVLGEGSVGANLRRVEALTGGAAYAALVEMRSRLEQTATVLRTQPDGLVAAATALADRSKDQERRLAAFEAQLMAGNATDLVDQAEDLGGRSLLVARRDGLAPDELRALAMQVRDRIGEGVVVLGSARDGKGGLVATVSPELAARGLSAGVLIAEAAKALGGGGSRDPELAQAGGPRGDGIEEALALARDAAGAALAKA